LGVPLSPSATRLAAEVLGVASSNTGSSPSSPAAVFTPACRIAGRPPNTP
jgi:hypothetical protein